MPQASINQMYFLQRHGIGLPKPQTQRGVTWAPKKRWSKHPVEAIIAYIKEGNGAGEETTPEKRLARYLEARERFEGKFVVETDGEDSTRYLVLEVVPETRGHLAWVAEEKGVDPSQVNPFCFDLVAEGEPADYEGHIIGPGNLDDYRLADEE